VLARDNQLAMPSRGAATEVAPGVYRLGTMWANFYLVASDGGFVLVDAGYPRYWSQVEAAFRELGKPLDGLAGVIVTHHHVDHAGTAEQARMKAGARVFVHEADAAKVSGDTASHPPQGFYRQVWRLTMLRYLAHTVMVGGGGYAPVSDAELIREDEAVLDLPGRPRVIHTPGHTAGHCSVVLDDRGVLLTGDAIQHFDYANGDKRLQLHRFNESRSEARRSLDRLAELDAEVVLFGHGDPWPNGAREAVEVARRAD
jgi:glyoxylase-like metal-dependent hydrolase (beta-lactamase superfamily II)